MTMATSLILPLHRIARQTPDAPALSLAERTHSVSERCALVARMAGELMRRGVGDTDRFALLAANDDIDLLSILAIIWAGAVAVPLSTRWADSEVGDALSDCSPRLLLTGLNPREAAHAICSLDISALCATSAAPSRWVNSSARRAPS
jgi:acyl-CoA synthetase (AMP-forming)/AMP-acid ligase II